MNCFYDIHNKQDQINFTKEVHVFCKEIDFFKIQSF